MQIRNQWTNRPKTKGEVNTLPSKTIPDQSLSVQEIMTRFAKGLSVGGAKVPVYHGEDEYLPEWKQMDLAEREEWINESKKDLADLKQQLNEKAAKQKKKDDQGPKVQRTTGDADDQGPTDQPDNPISAKNRPPGEGNTGKSR